MSPLSDAFLKSGTQLRDAVKAYPMGGFGLLALLLVWLAWPVHYQPKVLSPAVEDQPFAMDSPQPGKQWHPSIRGRYQSVQDRLDVTGASPNFILSVEMGSAGSGRLNLQSEDGQDLRELFAGPLQAGTWAFRWDGTGADTLPVAPGRYQIRWQRDRQSVVQSVQILGE
jgi:hypothetical protein